MRTTLRSELKLYGEVVMALALDAVAVHFIAVWLSHTKWSEKAWVVPAIGLCHSLAIFWIINVFVKFRDKRRRIKPADVSLVSGQGNLEGAYNRAEVYFRTDGQAALPLSSDQMLR